VLSLQPQGHCVLGAEPYGRNRKRQRPEHSARLLGRVDLGCQHLGREDLCGADGQGRDKGLGVYYTVYILLGYASITVHARLALNESGGL